MPEAFDDLKEAETTPPVMSFCDFTKPLSMGNDASSLAVGAVLAQREEDGKLHPIKFASRTMKDPERKFAICKRETLAVIFELNKFRVNLHSSKQFVLVTDNQVLSYALGKIYTWKTGKLALITYRI